MERLARRFQLDAFFELAGRHESRRRRRRPQRQAIG
jgi:hypothetical protein